MKRFIFLALFLLASVASAQTYSTSVQRQRYTGVGLAPEVAKELTSPLGISPSNALTIFPDNDPNRKLIIDSYSDTQISASFGDGGATAAQKFGFGATTADADDDSTMCMTGGGLNSSQYCDGTNRGASLYLYGNEVATYGGNAYFQNGNIAGADMYMTTSDDFIVTNISGTNALIVDAPTGNVSLPASGSTIALQEATPSTACMGTATPNGTTNVTVTTSCAVSGARVFFSRTGAVTNMASISVTTAPNGTNFTFASTGASDTLASSVVWMIIKKSA